MSENKFWVRDSNGNPIQMQDIWIRNQGSLTKIQDAWVRNSNGVAEKVYPTGGDEVETTTLIVLNQGPEIELPSLRFKEVFGDVDGVDYSEGIEELYRAQNVEFGLFGGVHNLGSPTGTLQDQVQTSLTPLINIFNSQSQGSFVWDWIGLDLENGTHVQTITRGGLDSTDIVPLNYVYFDLSGGPPYEDKVQQVFNSVQHYFPSATAGNITFHQLYYSCKQSTIDSINWIKTQAPTAKVMHWWKAKVSPIPLGGVGWWLHPVTVLDPNTGAPLDGDSSNFSSPYLRCVSGARTILGEKSHKETVVGNGTIVEEGNTTWTSGLDNYPYGSHQARAHAIAFEQAENSEGLQYNLDCISFQNYSPVYSIDRTLDQINPNGYLSVSAFDLVNGFTSTGEKYVKFGRGKNAVYLANRLNWLANWKQFGNKASMGMDLMMDYGVFVDNRFTGLHTEWETVRDYYVKAIIDPVTEAEQIRYGLPSSVIGQRIFPRYFSFWTIGYYLFWLIVTQSNGTQGRGAFLNNPDALARVRANLEWRFQDRKGAPPIDWMEGSAWHGFCCRQADLDGIERCQAITETITYYRNNPN